MGGRQWPVMWEDGHLYGDACVLEQFADELECVSGRDVYPIPGSPKKPYLSDPYVIQFIMHQLGEVTHEETDVPPMGDGMPSDTIY